jgi:hypothetical protein
MKFPHRRPSDADLASWLETGQPERVEKLIDDSDVTRRLEQLTRLPQADVDAIGAAVAPTAGFADRAASGVRHRVSDLERAVTLLGLLGLSVPTARTLLAEEFPPDDTRPQGF